MRVFKITFITVTEINLTFSGRATKELSTHQTNEVVSLSYSQKLTPFVLTSGVV